jgi:hypothetical protein
MRAIAACRDGFAGMPHCHFFVEPGFGRDRPGFEGMH